MIAITTRASLSVLLIGALLTTLSCQQPPVIPETTLKAPKVAPKKERVFKIKFTDKVGTEKTSPADLVKVKVNGVTVKTKVSADRSVLSLPGETDPAGMVEVETASKNTVSFRVAAIPPQDPEGTASATVWMMPWKKGEFLGEVGPDTKPMTALKVRATIVPLDRAIADASLVAIYLGPYRVPRHLVAVEGNNLLLDPTVAYYLKAARAVGDDAPMLRMLSNNGGSLTGLTTKVKNFGDEAPEAGEDGLPTLRGVTSQVAPGDVGKLTETDVESQAAFEANEVKLDESFFPQP